LQFHIWMPLLLVPLVVAFMLLLSLIRVLGNAIRWVIVWGIGFFAGGTLAWIGNLLLPTPYLASAVWAAGGFLGMIVFTSLYGMCLEWVFWLSRHENNPYCGLVSLSPEQQANRVRFAKSLHIPTAMASTLGGLMFAIGLFPIMTGSTSHWPSVGTWCLLGGFALATQGMLLGLFLGSRRERVVFDASKNSLGELIGWQIAGTQKGRRAALGWGLGYALHQIPTGMMAGLVLGALINLLFS
ncbi:MAG: hypothetical protein KDA84_26680, partial [Planctomycetaceae bacterium]|nr:hypothetical protein [Planctomycetaceae bacterium]